jgi:hypothetical protein
MESNVWTPADNDLTSSMKSLMAGLAVIYILGTALSLLNSLAAVIQLPCLGIGLPVAWYLQYGSMMYLEYSVAFAGTILVFVSMFLAFEVPGWEFLVPPKSRLHAVSISKRFRVAKPLSKRNAAIIMTVIIATMTVIAAFAFYTRSEEVSRLTVIVMIGNQYANPVGFSVYLDDEKVFEGVPDIEAPDHQESMVQLNLSAGTHTVVLDVWNELGQLVVDIPDSHREVRTLPYTTDVIHMTVGMGLI